MPSTNRITSEYLMNDILVIVFSALFYGFCIMTVAIVTKDFWNQGHKKLAVLFAVTSPFALIPIIIIATNISKLTFPGYYKRYFLSIVAVFAAISVSAYGTKKYSEQKESSQIRPLVGQYLEIMKGIKLNHLNVNGLEKLKKVRPIAKTVVVSSQENAIDDSYYLLPDEIKARSDEEVKVIARIECKEEPVFKYIPFGSTGYQVVCDCTVMDRASQQFIAMNVFKGGLPPSIKRYPGDRTGPRPNQAMADFIAGLY